MQFSIVYPSFETLFISGDVVTNTVCRQWLAKYPDEVIPAFPEKEGYHYVDPGEFMLVLYADPSGYLLVMCKQIFGWVHSDCKVPVALSQRKILKP